ncbi:hypothetical protein OTC26_016340 [Streptomyces tirandamycinicus]|uniref:hypothetical protein n=1 Tax=Streptomyces tirandamycinicus TaxID=2174846 RepID=UPI0022714D90|nr:hypothetical protein [Streptomyces tirandamycinicus]MCY0983847.1 hypothetical protein [Streptomyces tirandamycinicus]
MSTGGNAEDADAGPAGATAAAAATATAVPSAATRSAPGGALRRGTVFGETMLGTVLLEREDRARRIRLDLRVAADRVMRPFGTTAARASGRVRVAGWADDTHAEGELEISPLARRRIRYRISFTAEGRRFMLDGWKSITPRRPLASLTVLPFTLYEDGTRAGRGTLSFPVATQLPPFLASFRFPRATGSAETLTAPRWQGEPGRTEVWYTTLTDPASGTGLWLHHELVAPADGSEPYAHGWAAVFPKDGPMRHARFGPAGWTPGAAGFRAAGVEAAPGRLTGSAGALRWDLAEQAADAPLFTFPGWSWHRPLLPAAQILPAARASYDGTFSYDGTTLTPTAAPGASARIYGHGNARRWAWLHADLGGGDVLEIVAAVSMRPGLRRLPPLVFLRLRRGPRTWPRRAERSAVGWAGLGRFRAAIGLPVWTVSGRAGLRRIRVEVTQPEDRTIALDYTDPDGSRAVCRNSERAGAHVLLERWWFGGWRTEAEWTLDDTAHAEVGTR